jgi:hypothetical protein
LIEFKGSSMVRERRDAETVLMSHAVIRMGHRQTFCGPNGLLGPAADVTVGKDSAKLISR